MKRQSLRKGIQFISFLLFPITIYYFSPYLIIMGGLKGIVSGSFIMFIAMFLVSLFFGRSYCAWLCPGGGVMDCCAVVSGKNAKGGRLNLIKYFIWIPWVTTIIFIFIRAGGIKKFDFFFHTTNGISVLNPEAYIVYYFILAMFVILAFTAGKRAACHYICWMAPFMIIGTKIRNKLKYPSLHLECDASKCVNCRMCDKKCPMSLEVSDMVKKGDMNNPECIMCGECVDSCNKKAVHYKFKH